MLGRGGDRRGPAPPSWRPGGSRCAGSASRTRGGRRSPGQIVTEADIAVDRFLRAELVGGGADGWLSEETRGRPQPSARPARSGWSTRSTGRARSPRASPSSRSAWRCCVEDRPVLGFVYNPATEEMFEAVLRQRRLPQRRADAGKRRSRSLDDAHIVASRFESRRRNFAAAGADRRAELLGLARLQAGPGRGRPLRRLSVLAPDQRLGHRRRRAPGPGGRRPDHRRVRRPIRLNRPGAGPSRGCSPPGATLFPRLLAATAGANAPIVPTVAPAACPD